MEVLNLKARFGRRLKVEYEESYFAEYGPGARVEDPVLMVVACKWGEIHPAGGTTLAASVGGYPKVAGRLRRLKCCRVHQEGDHGELTVTFDVADFAKITKIMRPRRRRQVNLTPEQRQEVARRLREGRERASQPVVQGRLAPRRDVSGPQGDSERIGRQLALFDA